MVDTVVTVNLFNNLWVLLCGALVFIMTISVGLLEIGELGKDYRQGLLKTIIIVCVAFFMMAFIGFNTAFAPCIGGIIGNPLYSAPFLGGFRPIFPVCSRESGGQWGRIISTRRLRFQPIFSLRPLLLPSLLPLSALSRYER